MTRAVPLPSASADNARPYVAFALALMAASVICVRLLVLPGYEGDLAIYRDWVRLITQQGITAAYSGTYPETAANYPPVLLYLYLLVGKLSDPADPTRLTVAIKSVAAIAHLGLGVVIFALLQSRYAAGVAAMVAALYLLNPAQLLDAAYWGQPDAVHTLALALGFWYLEAHKLQAGWIAASIAALSKPQAWLLLPLFAARSFVRCGAFRTLQGISLTALTAFVVLLPFVLTGRIGDFLNIMKQVVIANDTGIGSGIPHTAPVATAFAHNLWWLVTSGKAQTIADLVSDQTALFDGVTYRVAGEALVVLATAFVLWQAVRPDAPSIFVLAALQAFAWFCLTTGAHENHAFMVLPLLALALPIAPWTWPIWAALSLTTLLNLVLQDPAFLSVLARIATAAPVLSAIADAELQRDLRLANSAANLLILIVWFVALPRSSGQTHAASIRRG